jgi:hypothetical protein
MRVGALVLLAAGLGACAGQEPGTLPFDPSGYALAQNGEMVKVVDHGLAPPLDLFAPKTKLPAHNGALDGRCTLGPLSGIISATYPGASCCQEHDKCYHRNGCTILSWFGIQGGDCMACNLRVVTCLATGSLVFGSECNDWYNECEYRSHQECVQARCGGDPVCGVQVCEQQLGYYPGDHYELFDTSTPSEWANGWYYTPEDGWRYLGEFGNAYCWRDPVSGDSFCEVGGELTRGGMPQGTVYPCDSFVDFVGCYLNLI